MKNGSRRSVGGWVWGRREFLIGCGLCAGVVVGCSLNAEGVNANQTGAGSSSSSGSSSSGAGGAGTGGSIFPSSSSGSSSGMGGAGTGGASSSSSSSSSSSGGGMGGMGGAGGGPTMYSWTATDPKVSGGGFGSSACKDYAYVLPDWMTFTSPTPNRSTQISDQALCIGFAANDPRARNVGPAGNAKWGLSVEAARTNLVLQSDSWNGGGAWTAPMNPGAMQIGTAKPDPAMGNKATQFDNDSVGNPAGQQSPYQGITKARAISTWAKGVGAAAVNCSVFGGGTENCYARFRFDASMGAGYVNVTKTVWNRLSYTFPADVTDALVFDTKNQPAGAGVISGQTSFLAFGAQAEKANYPSSYIPTTNATVTRETEELMIPGTKLATIIPNKYFELTIRFAPNFADTELSTDYHLFQIHDGEKWRIYLKASSKQVIVVLNNGTYITSDPITFSREQELEIHLKNLQGMLVELTIGGATTGSGTFMSAMNGIAATNNVDTFILSHHDGAEECSDLRFFELK